MTSRLGMACRVLAAHLLVLPSAVQAEGQEEDQAVIVVSAAGVPQDRDASGQAISIIDSQTIEAAQANTVAELLQRVPSVRVNANGGLGAVTGVSLRGAETGQVLVLLDGVPLNDPSSTNGAVDFGNLLVGNIHRIEVMRGSNAVPYGSEAMGGVIAISTRDPGQPQGLTMNASVEGGYANSAQAVLDTGWREGDLRIDAGITALRTDGISSADRRFGASERDGLENLTVHARIEVPLADGVRLDLRGYAIDARLEYDSFFGMPMDTADTSRFRQATGYAGLDVTMLDGALQNRLAFTYLVNGRDYRFAPGQPVDFGFRGNEWRLDYRGSLAVAEPADLLFGFAHEAPDYRFFGFGSDEKHDASTDSAFALLVLRPMQRLSVSGGVRREGHGRFDAVTTFGLNANLGLGDGQTRLRAAFGEGFRTPSLYQLFDSFSGNDQLQPERSESYDIGIDRSLLGGRGQVAVTLFARNTRNQIDFDFASFRFANLARTRARGVEVEARVQPVPDLDLALAYSLVDSRNRTAGSPSFGDHLPRRPVHGLTLNIDKTWSSGLRVGATLRLAGDALDPATSDRLDGYAVTGLRASMPLAERLELFARVDNLFDARSVTAYGYGSMPRAAYAGIKVRL